MTSREALHFLDSFINYEAHLTDPAFRKIKLERMERLMDLLGRPQESLRVLHVAGTKGKGSVCAFAAHILRAMGFRTGLYTSPHLIDVKERVRLLEEGSTRISGGLFADSINDGELGLLLTKMRPSLEKMRMTDLGQLTYFEVLTALAFVFFKEQGAEYVVLETGLGGRLDATNVCRAQACAMTSLGLEHTQILGDRLEQIAGEKAAIIKVPGRPVIVAPQEEEARAVIEERCRRVGVRPTYVGEDLTCQVKTQTSDGQTFLASGPWGKYRLRTSLPGAHQAVNAMTALGLVWAVEGQEGRFYEDSVAVGVKQAQWPGRFETIYGRCLTVLDSAHTPLACRALAQTLREIFPDRSVVLVLGISADKDVAGICRELVSVAGRVILTAGTHPRARRWTQEDGKKYFPGCPCELARTTAQAWKRAQDLAAEDDIVLITGSIFLIGEIYGIVKER